MSDVVSKGQNVKVKVLSITGKKISLSMKVSLIFLQESVTVTKTLSSWPCECI